MFKCRFEEKQHVRGSNQANNLLPCGPYLKEIFTLEHVCSNGIRCGQSVVPDVPSIDFTGSRRKLFCLMPLMLTQG